MRKSIAVSFLTVILAVAQIVYIGYQFDWQLAAPITVSSWKPLFWLIAASMIAVWIGTSLIQSLSNHTNLSNEYLLRSDKNMSLVKQAAVLQSHSRAMYQIPFYLGLATLISAAVLTTLATHSTPTTGRTGLTTAAAITGSSMLIFWILDKSDRHSTVKSKAKELPGHSLPTLMVFVTQAQALIGVVMVSGIVEGTAPRVVAAMTSIAAMATLFYTNPRDILQLWRSR